MDLSVRHPDPSTEFFTPERCWILEAWSSPSDPLVSLARARVEAGVTTQLHRSRGVDERYLIVEGSGIVRVGWQPPQVVGPGDVIAIPAGTPQQSTNDAETDLIFYCICSPPFTPECYENLEPAESP
ncbi:MAG TPA: cupin domain-containing protein [Longimicrobiales bacterium]|nr:cupin domain-containing protein [Longimicrobiales bacterium]